MKIEIDKSDLVTLIVGSIPHYSIWNSLNALSLGAFNGTTFQWVDFFKLMSMDEKILIDIYKTVKNSYSNKI